MGPIPVNPQHDSKNVTVSPATPPAPVAGADPSPPVQAHGVTPPMPSAELSRNPTAEAAGRALGAQDALRRTTQQTGQQPPAPAQDPFNAEIDAVFAAGKFNAGTMVQFTDRGGPLAGSGPKQGTGDIWYHDNIKIPGAGPGGAPAELRTHSANPNAPPGSYSHQNYTTQVSSTNGMYRLPDGSWKTMAQMTPAERAAAHYPAGK